MTQLRHGSELIERLSEQNGLLIVGAEYSLESGVVQVFDGVQVREANEMQEFTLAVTDRKDRR